MQIAQLMLEYVRVLLSAPAIAGAAAVLFLVLFRQEIRALIGRIATIRFPGGELSTTQLERASEASRSTVPPQPAPDANTLPQNLNLTPDQRERLVDFIRSERARAALWEYRFLNYYLVPDTQRVLDWLISLGQRPTVQFFDSWWLPLIHHPNERRAILDALRTHHLVDLQGDLLEVTPKGREYAAWRGPLPRLPLTPPLQPAGTVAP